MTDRVDPRLVLAFEEARRAVEQQAQHVAGLRNRAATLLGTAAVAASFFAVFSTRDNERPSALTWVGVAVFALVCALLFAVLRPAPFTFENDAATLLSAYVDKGASIDEMHRSLAGHLAGHFRANKVTLDRLVSLYQLAIIVLAVEIVMFVIDLRGRA